MASDVHPSSPARRAALAGIGFMAGGIFLFAVNDALGKWLMATYTVGQVLLIRSLGYLVFGDVPDAAMLLGAAIIIGAGLFILLRERQLARRASFAEPPP